MNKPHSWVIFVISLFCIALTTITFADPPDFSPLKQTAEGRSVATGVEPLPGLTDPTVPAGPLGRLASYDLRTGELTYLDVDTREDYPAGTFRSGGDGVLIGPAVDAVDKNFTNWDLIPDPSFGTYPRHVKLEICWDPPCGEGDYGGGCSGTLIDPFHVITNGHCVYSYDGDHPGWAESIRVVPGCHDDLAPFGRAESDFVMAWSGWYEDEDTHHDIGVIQLQRPIGALVGWRGYSFNENCSWYENGGGWVHRSYPGDDFSNGRRMYENGGDFDWCLSDDTLDLHMVWFQNQSYRGCSGTGAVYDNVVYAVLRGGLEGWTEDVIITSEKFAGIETLRNDLLPTTHDLMPIYVQAGGEDYTAGAQLDSLSFILASYSDQGLNSSVICHIYLSDDPTITTGDVWLDDISVPVNVPAMSAQIVGVWPPPTVPVATASGRYYIGVFLDYTDAVLSNNITAPVEVDSITVDCPLPYSTAVVTPVHGSTCQPLSVTLDWADTPDIEIYELRFGTWCGEAIVYTGSTSQHTVSGLDYDTTYHAIIRMKKYCGAWSPWGSCHNFTTLDVPTSEIEFLTPTPGDICQDSTSVSIAWQPVPDTDDYQLQVGESCGSGAVYTLDASTPYHDVTGLAGDTTYFYHVRVMGACGNWGDWSACGEFSTLPGIYPVPVQTQPLDGNACMSPHTVLSWQPPGYPCSYEVEWGVDCRMDTITVVTTPYVQLPPLAEGTWYWHVRALHVCGGISSFSPCWSFGVDGTPPVWPGYLESTSHETSTWSNVPVVTTIWEDADDDCMVEYRIVWDHLPTTEPDSLAQTVPDVTHDSEPLPDGDDHWVHVLAKDVPGNLADTTEHLGPFWIDTTPPDVQVINPVGGQYLVSGSPATITWTANDIMSGVASSELHYTTDAAVTWHPIATYADPMISTHDWTVPEATTDSARVRVTVTDMVGNAGAATNERWFSIGTGVGVGDPGNPATHFALAGNYPNPFNPSTTIRFAAPGPAHVKLGIFDLQGRRVCTLLDGPVDGPAWHEAQWNGNNSAGQQVAAGVYFCRLVAEEFCATARMVLVK
jgi:hypothetical protein